MADIAKVQLKRDEGVDVTKANGAASATIVYDRSDENIMIYIENGDAAACRVKFSTNGFGGEDLADLDVDIAAGEFAAVGVLESMKFKDPATQKVTVQVLDQDNTAFSGTVTNVKFVVFAAPKSLVD